MTIDAPRSLDESERLAALGRCGLLDTPAEAAFDDLARLAARWCGTPMAAISLVDVDRQWFKARVGLDAAETPRDVAFCAHAILQDGLMVVPDALDDPRFARNPLVTGGPNIRFYAGVPLKSTRGHALGTLCVIDRVPRVLRPDQADDLIALARQASAQIELRRLATEADRARDSLEAVGVARDAELADAIAALRAEVAERRRAEAELRVSDERYSLAVRSSNEGIWDWDILTGHVHCSPRLEELLGRAEVPETVEAWEDSLHPEDRERVESALHDHIQRRLPYDIEYRIRSKIGDDRWFRARGQAVWDRSGKATRMAGSMGDITARKRAEEALRRAHVELERRVAERTDELAEAVEALRTEVAERRRAEAEAREGASILRGFYDGSPMAMGIGELTDDGDVRFVSANTTTATFRGVTVEAILGRRASRAGFTPAAIALWREKALESGRTGRPVLFEYASEGTAEQRWYSATACPVAQGEGGLPRFAFIVEDTSARKRAADETLALNRLLSCIQKAQAEFIDDADPRAIFDTLLAGVLELTGSTYGFIGEVCRDDSGAAYLKCHAVTDISRDDRVRADVAGQTPEGMEFRNLRTLFGAVITTGKAVLANDPANDPRRGEGPPHGHPRLDSFLGLPLALGEGIVGMVGMANRPGGYDEAMIRFLKPFLATCANLTEAHRNNRRRKRAEEEVRGLNEELERRLSRIDALRRIDAAIATGHEIGTTLGVVLDQVLEQLRADAADILLLDPHTGTLEHASSRGFRAVGPPRACLGVDTSLAGLAVRGRRPVRIDDLRAHDGPIARPSLLTTEGFVSYEAVPLMAKGQVQGVLEVFHRAPHDPDPDGRDFLDALAGQASIAVDNASLFDGLQRSNLDLTLAYDATIEGWSRALDLRDHETEGHTRRVTEMTLRLARVMGVDGAEMVQVRRGSLLHDIGKMGIPDVILLKPGPLTEQEWEVMRKHPTYALEMLSPIAFLRPALEIPYCHHEKWDGTGYPRGLAGEQIPLPARIFAAVDIWDALRSDRPYRAGWPEARVREHIANLSGTHLDPDVVRAFLPLLKAHAPG